MELHQLFTRWFDNNLPATTVTVGRSIELPGGRFHPTDVMPEEKRSITLDNIKAAIDAGAAKLPDGMTVEDLQRKLVVGTRVIRPLITMANDIKNDSTIPLVDFVSVARLWSGPRDRTSSPRM